MRAFDAYLLACGEDRRKKKVNPEERKGRKCFGDL